MGLVRTCADGLLLPGHARPVLEHDWPHPSELGLGDSGFAPARLSTPVILPGGRAGP